MTKEINRIGVLTSGGDAPGMNAAIRAVVRTASYYGKTPYAIYRGYDGLVRNEVKKMNVRSVSNVLGRGGTILKSARSEAFRTEEGMEQAYQTILEHKLDGMVVIGGNGTFAGAHEFFKRYQFPVIGIPGTIDNDLYGTDFTIGYDTATNVVTEAIDKIRDTASSHDRLFFVEVMGRDSGFIALNTGIATGAIAIMLPEEDLSVDELIQILDRGAKSRKTSSIVLVAEGDGLGGAYELANKVKEKYNHYDTRVTILGHLQRGGSPSCLDRVLASQMGVHAVEAMINGRTDVMVGSVNNKMTFTFLENAVKLSAGINTEKLRIAKILSI